MQCDKVYIIKYFKRSEPLTVNCSLIWLEPVSLSVLRKLSPIENKHKILEVYNKKTVSEERSRNNGFLFLR